MAEEKYRHKSKLRNYLRAIVLALGGFYFGYYIACMNALTSPLLQDVLGYQSTKDEQLIKTLSGLVNLLFGAGALIGTLITGELVKVVGRRPMLYAGDIVGILNIIPSCIPGTGALLLCRIISGIATGIILSTYSIVLAELLPNKVCGFGGALGNFFIGLGILFSYLNQNVASYSELVKYWQLFFAYPLVINVFRLIAYFFLFKTDTPSFEFDKATKKIQSKVAPSIASSNAVIHTETDAISPNSERKTLGKEEEETNKTSPLPSSSSSNPQIDIKGVTEAYSHIYHEDDVDLVVKDSVQFWTRQKVESGGNVKVLDLFKGKYRRQFLSGFFTAFTFHFAGTNFIILYSTLIFDSIIPNSGKLITLISGISNIGGGLIGIFTIEFFGRKPNIVFGTIFQGLGMLLLIIGYVQASLALLIIGTIVFIAGFSFGIGGTYATYTAEVLPPTGVGIVLSTQWALSMFIGIIVPFMLTWVGPLAMMVFFLIYNAIATVIDWLFVVETKGKSPQEITAEFHRSWIHVCNRKK